MSTHRPVHNERVRGQVQVAALALPQRRLRAAGKNLSAHSALRVLTTARPVEFEAVEGRRQRMVTKGTKQERKALNALKIPRMQPPRVLAQASGTEQGMNVVITRE